MQERKCNWRPFEEARQYVHELGLRNWKEWQTWSSSGARPTDIPANPYIIYKEMGWYDMGDWLGIEKYKGKFRKFLSFDEARKYVQGLGLKNCIEWQGWSRNYRPINIPSDPKKIYEKEGWKSYGDWLGTGRIANKKRIYRPFQKARAYACNLVLKNIDEWRAWAKGNEHPKDIPSDPDKVYKKKGWKSWADWLGTGRVYLNSYGIRPFEEARKYARNLGLKNSLEWVIWCKTKSRPKDIPSQPFRTYRGKGWISYGDWLGTGRPGKK
jgi:hypothetical protein